MYHVLDRVKCMRTLNQKKICHIVDSKVKCLNATWLMHTALKSIRIKKAGFKKNNKKRPRKRNFKRR